MKHEQYQKVESDNPHLSLHREPFSKIKGLVEGAEEPLNAMIHFLLSYTAPPKNVKILLVLRNSLRALRQL